MSLALAQSSLPQDQIARASTVLARYFDLPPQWFFPSLGRVAGPSGAPMRVFTDPESGQAISLATARRLLRAHEDEVIERMLREALVQPVEVPGPPTGVAGYEQVSAKRVAQAVRAMAPLRGEDLPFKVAFAMALDIAASALNLEAFSANLSVTSRLEGLSPVLAAEIARRGAQEGRVFRTAYDVAGFVAPGAEPGVEEAKAYPTAQEVAARREQVAAAAAAGKPIPVTLEEVGGAPISAVLGRELVAGLIMPGDFLASLKEAETNYVKAGEQIANQIKIPFSDSFAGKALGWTIDRVLTRPVQTVVRLATGPAEALVLLGFGGGDVLERGDPRLADREASDAIRDALSGSFDIIMGRTTLAREYEEIGIHPAFSYALEFIAGFRIFNADPALWLLRGAARAKEARTVFGPGVDWGRVVTDAIDGPLGRGPMSLVMARRYRNTSLVEHLFEEIVRSDDAERFFGRALRNLRTPFTDRGIPWIVAERMWRLTRAGRRLGLSEAELKEGIRTVLYAGTGVRPPPGSLAARIGREVEDLRAVQAQQLPLFLADGSRYEAATTRLTRDAYVAASTLDEALLDEVPRILALPKLAGAPTRLLGQLADAGFAEGRIGRTMRALRGALPQRAGARLLLNIERETAVDDFGQVLRVSAEFSADEITRAKLQFQRAIRPGNPDRARDAGQVVTTWERDAIGRLSSRYGVDADLEARILDALQARFGRGTRLHQTFAARAEGATVTTRETPILLTQELNEIAMLDPALYRRVLIETIGTLRKWNAAMFRAAGFVPHPTRPVRTIPIRKFLDEALELIVGDVVSLFLKPLYVIRPAYVLRIVGLEETNRFLATLGPGRWATSGKLLTGARVADALDQLPSASRIGRAAARVVPGGERIAEGIRARGAWTVRVEGPEGVIEVTMPRVADLPDEALAMQGAARFALAEPGPIGRAIREMSGDFGVVRPSDPQFYPWWHNVLVNEFGRDVAGHRYLDDIARGVSEEDSVRAALRWFETAEGRAYARQLMGAEWSADDLEEQVRIATGYLHDLTGGNRRLAAAARDGSLGVDDLRAVPEDLRPSVIHGPLMNETMLGRVGPLKRFRDFAARWILQEPTNRLTRQKYFKSWYDRVLRSLVDQVPQGRPITEEMLAGFQAAAREFGLSQVRRIMFDFTRQGRLDQLTRWFLMFVQPYLEFPVAWGRIIRQNPAVLYHAVRLGRLGLQSGFVHEDEETGELVVPLSWWAGAAPLLAAFTGGRLGGFGSGGGWELFAPLTSFNLFAQSTFQLPGGKWLGDLPIPMPAFTPHATALIQNLVSRTDLRSDIKARFASWAFAYGPITADKPLSIMPAWLRHGIAGAFPQWLESETNLQQTHFLLLQQAMGMEPDPDLARTQAREFSFARAFFALVFPAAPRIEFPTAELEAEWRSYVEQGPDYSTARTRFLEAHPGLDLIAIARTMWAEENPSPIPIAATQAVSQLLTTKGAKEFAAKHPAWVWAIIPRELREGTFDIGSFFAQIASGQRVVLTPEAFLAKAEVQQGWDAYFALHEGWVAWTEAHPLIGEGDPSYDEEYADFAAARDHIAEMNPAWAAEWRTFELGGVEPRVMAEARNLAKNELFQQTEVGTWLVSYFALRDSTAADMAKAGIHSIRTKTAERLGITERYDSGVQELNTNYPDGATAYRLFFSRDLEHELTPGDRRLDRIPEETFDNRITPWWTQFEILREGPDLAPDEGARSEAFNAIRAYVDLAYQNFGAKENPLVLRWETADPTWQQDYLVALVGRPYAYLNRFDKTYVLKNPTNDSTEKVWTLYAQARGLIAEREALDPEFSSTRAYEALGLWVAVQAKGNERFAAQVAGANQWGYQFRRLLERPDMARALFGTEPKFSMPYWRGFLDGVDELQRVVDAAKLGGSFDPRAKVAYNVLRGELLRYVGTLKEASVEFAQQWDFLEKASGTDPLISYFMPEFSSYFGPIQGYAGGPR